MTHIGIRLPIAAAVVLLWRLAAMQWPSPFIELDDDLRLPMTLLGILFLGCGLAPWLARPGRWTRLLFVAGAAGGVHWGGALGFDVEWLDMTLLLVYLGVSVAGEAALLHLAIIYPMGGWVTAPLRVALYAPAAAAIALAPFAALIPMGTLQLTIGVLTQLATAFTLVAALIFVISLIRLHAEMRRTARLTVIVLAFIIGGAATILPSLGLVPGPAEAWHLLAIAIPFALAYALITTPLETPD